MNSISRCKPLLGTYVEVTLSANENRDTLIDMSIAAFSEIEKIEILMSFHDVNSELSYLNNFAHLQACNISKETAEVLQQAIDISQKTNGLFDITIAPELVKQGMLPDNKLPADESGSWENIHLHDGVVSFDKPMLIDFGGIAKGYGVDKAMSVFGDDVDVVINAGGDLRMSHWQEKTVQIKYTNSNREDVITMPMQAAAVATSANYYLDGKSAIVSPKTSKPIANKNSYSVFASTCMLADALTKVAFLSEENNNLINSFDAHLISINEDGFISTI